MANTELVCSIIGWSCAGILGIALFVAIVRDALSPPDYTIHEAPIRGNYHTICTKDTDVLHSELARLQRAGFVCDGSMVMGGQRNHFFIQRMRRQEPS